MEMDIVIKNGEIVTASDMYEADIDITGGKIVAIGKGLDGNETIDAKGMYVMPGAVDAHVHFQHPFRDTVSADDFKNGTKASACGGPGKVHKTQSGGRSRKYLLTENLALKKGGSTLV